MKKRSFLKSLLLILGFSPLKLFPYDNKEKISFDYGVASGDPTNSHIILWTKVGQSRYKNCNKKSLRTSQKRIKTISI